MRTVLILAALAAPCLGQISLEEAQRKMEEKNAAHVDDDLGRLTTENQKLREQLKQLQAKVDALTAELQARDEVIVQYRQRGTSDATPATMPAPARSIEGRNVRSPEDVSFGIIKSDAARFAGQTVTIVAGVEASSYYNFSWSNAEADYYSLGLREVTEDGGLGAGGHGYLARARGDGLIRAAASAAAAKNAFKLAHLKVIVCPHQLQPAELPEDCLEIVSWQFIKPDGSGWEAWSGDASAESKPGAKKPTRQMPKSAPPGAR